MDGGVDGGALDTLNGGEGVEFDHLFLRIVFSKNLEHNLEFLILDIFY